MSEAAGFVDQFEEMFEVAYRAADARTNVLVLDWEVLAADCPSDCFYGDGIHLRPVGQQYYADLIADIIGL